MPLLDAAPRNLASGAIVALLALAGCTTPAPMSTPATAESAPVVRTPLPEAPLVTPRAPARAAVAVPSGVQYVCVVDVAGERKQTAIEFAPKVAELCARHPEMGPCQYERNLCRRSGGRVYAAGGDEITTATEAEYDRKVLRVRFKAN